MAEIDYQMALLLQYKFQQELKRSESTECDHQLALELQEQFESEIEVEKSGNNLVYKHSTHKNSTKSLVDPSWEVIDPTPDVRVLFMAFNQKFFWNALGSVTVSWSKRMTTCAGICSYQGRGGMCSITLSGPLLKLRPRKDLVETLLHEMIHAYLFVTNNNRDRDGHGPEFHKHMYRINAEAGTNITVYHDFHDEVRLYKQHWWRCDGPCQHRKPYFGMVRRAMNRPPGPNDRWWGEHSRSCGGTFIKVKSPEPTIKESSSKKKAVSTKNPQNSNNDIRKYISSSSPINNKNIQTTSKTPVNCNPSKPVAKTSELNNIHTVSNSSGSPQVSNVISSKASNIFGFTNLGAPSTSKKHPGVKGTIKNAGSNTFVVTKPASKSNAIDNKSKTSTSGADVTPFAGTGRSLTNVKATSSDNKDYSVVRDHWLKKFGDSSLQSGTKRPSSSPCSSADCSKVPKLTNCDNSDKVECPVCRKLFKMKELNTHLDHCLEDPSDNSRECIICGIKIAAPNYEKHISDCTSKNFSDDNMELVDSIQCTVCLKSFNPSIDSNHIDTCKRSNIVDITKEDDGKGCPVCNTIVPSKEYNVHLQNCILSMCEDMDRKYESHEEKTCCLACDKEILKSELDSHLEECMGMSNVFDTTNVPVEDVEDVKNDLGMPEDTYNCPFCLKLVTENNMQTHLDRCLKNEDVSDENDIKERSLLVVSLCSTDSDVD